MQKEKSLKITFNTMENNSLRFSDIISAQNRLRGITKVTTLMTSKSFSTMAEANVFLKLENMQTTGSFKVRGAFNKLATLKKEEMANGVVAASAGNHAQGVAYSATRLGIKSTVFMPIFTPPLKVIATRAYGAKVILSGDSFDDAFASSQEFCEKQKATYIHPFNDPMIIAGQGTIGLEIHEQLPEVDAVIIPIGGGGLIAGVALALKEMNPKIKIIGVEASGAASMFESRTKNKVVTLPHISTIADGIAVKTPGTLTFDLTQKYVDEIVTVNDTEIAQTTYLLLQRAKILAEPSGVTSMAAALYKKSDLCGKNIVALISGGNINMHLLEQIVEKGMMGEGLRACIRVSVPDQSGELRKLLAILDRLKSNIIDIVHERSNLSIPIGYVRVSITLNLQDQSQLKVIQDELSNRGLTSEVIQ